MLPKKVISKWFCFVIIIKVYFLNLAVAIIGLHTCLSWLRFISCELTKRRTSNTCGVNVNMHPNKSFLFFPIILIVHEMFLGSTIWVLFGTG